MKNPWALEGKNPWKKDKKEPSLEKKSNPWGLPGKEPWEKAETDKEKIARLEKEVEDLKINQNTNSYETFTDKEEASTKTIKKKSSIGLMTWVVVIVSSIYVYGQFNSENKTSLSLEEKISKAHTQYAKRDVGIRSSYLPRVGTIKGEDYRNCIDNKYWFDQSKGIKEDQEDFCRWHAELGSYSK